VKRTSNIPTPDDVARLVSGKPTRSRVGSRAIAHRLRRDEHAKLSIAAQRGFLLIHATTRPALLNAWHLWCRAHKQNCKVLRRKEGEQIMELLDLEVGSCE
jgi:hypothetical protein